MLPASVNDFGLGLIQPVLPDVFLNRARHSESQAASRVCSFANLRGREFDGRHRDQPHAIAHDRSETTFECCQVRRRKLSTIDSHNGREIQNCLRLAPQRQVRQRVGPHQEEEFAIRLLDAQLPQRLDRVRRPAPFDFNAADSKSRITGDGEFQHLDALLARRNCSARLVRRLAARQKQHAIQRTHTSRQVSASKRCPRCTGSNEPP